MMSPKENKLKEYAKLSLNVGHSLGHAVESHC